MKYNLAFACAAMLLLPACLKSDDPDVPVETGITLENLGDRAEAFAGMDLGPTRGDVPQADGVEYVGVAVYGERTLDLSDLDSLAVRREPEATTSFLAVGAAQITTSAMSSVVDVAASNFFQIAEPETLDLEEFSNLENSDGTAIDGTMSGTLGQRKVPFISEMDIGYLATHSGTISGTLTRVGETKGTAVEMDVAGGFLGENAEVFVATTPGFTDNPYVDGSLFAPTVQALDVPTTGTRLQREPIQIEPLTQTFGGVVGVVVPD